MKRLEVHLSDELIEVLKSYCKQKELTQSEAVRTWVRGLKRACKES